MWRIVLQTGTIPVEISNLVSVWSMALQYNSFVGDVPDQVCDLLSVDGLAYLTADCLQPREDPTAFNDCLCCTSCCDRITKDCDITENVQVPDG